MVRRTGRGKLLVWWKGGLAQGAASVMVDWNMKTFSVVDVLAQRAAKVMVHVCALRIQEAIPFSWEKKEYTYLTRMPV